MSQLRVVSVDVALSNERGRIHPDFRLIIALESRFPTFVANSKLDEL